MHKAIHSSHQRLGEVGVKTDFTGCICRKPLTWNGLQLIPEWDLPPHCVIFQPGIYNQCCEKSNNKKEQTQYILNNYMLYFTNIINYTKTRFILLPVFLYTVRYQCQRLQTELGTLNISLLKSCNTINSYFLWSIFCGSYCYKRWCKSRTEVLS